MVDVFLGQSFSDRRSRRNNNTAIWFRKLAFLMGKKGLAKLEPAGPPGKARRGDQTCICRPALLYYKTKHRQNRHSTTFSFWLSARTGGKPPYYYACSIVCVCERDGVTRTSFPPMPPLDFFPEQAYTKLFDFVTDHVHFAYSLNCFPTLLFSFASFFYPSSLLFGRLPADQ